MLINKTVINGGQQSPQDISNSWVEENHKLSQLQNPIPILEFGVQSLSRDPEVQFKILEFMTQTKQHVGKLYKDPVQFSFNRYNTILPYQYSMVKLKPLPGGHTSDQYINANFIRTPFDQIKIVATQGPLSSTVCHFWRAVQQTDVSTIFMLCNLEQRNVLKCYKYWPSKDDSEMLLKSGLKVTCVSEETIEDQLVKRVFHLSSVNSQEASRQILHFHWKDWKDNEAPSPNSIDTLERLLLIAKNLMAQGEKLLVHCSAGVGRTGSFIALLNMIIVIEDFHRKWVLKQIEDEEMTISVFGTVRRLRQQRWGMVFKKVQYQFIYQFIRNYIGRLFEPETFPM